MINVIAHRKGCRKNRQVFDKDGITEAIDTAGGGGREFHTEVQEGVRRLTPIEYERLQAFPDGFTDCLSDTQRYKCVGNAVTTSVITAIGSRILEVMEGVDLCEV